MAGSSPWGEATEPMDMATVCLLALYQFSADSSLVDTPSSKITTPPQGFPPVITPGTGLLSHTLATQHWLFATHEHTMTTFAELLVMKTAQKVSK